MGILERNFSDRMPFLASTSCGPEARRWNLETCLGVVEFPYHDGMNNYTNLNGELRKLNRICKFR